MNLLIFTIHIIVAAIFTIHIVVAAIFAIHIVIAAISIITITISQRKGLIRICVLLEISPLSIPLKLLLQGPFSFVDS